MFPRSFTKKHTQECYEHDAICFRSTLTNDQVVETIMKMGVLEFIRPQGRLDGTNANAYPDKRINGYPSFIEDRACCSFTRNSNQWYLFSITERQLTNVGLTQDDLLRWIKFLNEMRVGFQFKYFGMSTLPAGLPALDKYVRQTTHWVGVPDFASDNTNLAYLHWISLRYLISTNIGTLRESLPYYAIPRAAVMLHEDFGLTKIKSFLYAHMIAPIYAYKAMCNNETTYDAAPDSQNTYLPDISLNSIQFKKLWNKKLAGMNNMIAPLRGHSDPTIVKKVMSAPYHPRTCYELWQKGDYKGFIAYLDSVYKPEKVKTKKTKVKESVS